MARAATTGCQSDSAEGNASSNTRTSATNAAAFTAVAMKPVTGVGGPTKERHGGHFEPHADEQQTQTEGRDQRRLAPGQLRADEGEVGSSSGAVDQRDSVEKKAGCERPDKEVFEGRLSRKGVGAV